MAQFLKARSPHNLLGSPVLAPRLEGVGLRRFGALRRREIATSETAPSTQASIAVNLAPDRSNTCLPRLLLCRSHLLEWTLWRQLLRILSRCRYHRRQCQAPSHPLLKTNGAISRLTLLAMMQIWSRKHAKIASAWVERHSDLRYARPTRIREERLRPWCTARSVGIPF